MVSIANSAKGSTFGDGAGDAPGGSLDAPRRNASGASGAIGASCCGVELYVCCDMFNALKMSTIFLIYATLSCTSSTSLSEPRSRAVISQAQSVEPWRRPVIR